MTQIIKSNHDFCINGCKYRIDRRWYIGRYDDDEEEKDDDDDDEDDVAVVDVLVGGLSMDSGRGDLVWVIRTKKYCHGVNTSTQQDMIYDDCVGSLLFVSFAFVLLGQHFVLLPTETEMRSTLVYSIPRPK
jgi:hypothetical protein